jgi:hypothetical protein
MLLTTLAAFLPISMLLAGSLLLFFKVNTVASFLQVFGAACLMVVVLTHLFEAFNILTELQWGLPNSVGHYLDLWSAIVGLTLFPLGYLWQAIGRQGSMRC